MSSPRPEQAITVARYDLDTAIALARQIRASGLAPAPLRQLAAALTSAAKPDTFMNKFYSAAKYGLVALHRDRITVAGLAVTLPLLDALDDPAREQEARARACLNVALHRAIVDRYQGQPLVPTVELERVMAEELGVSTGQVANARLVALRSLHQAGLVGKDGRLTAPQTLEAIDEERSVNQQMSAVEGVRLASDGASPQRAETAAPVAEKEHGSIAGSLGQVPPAVLAWLARMPAEDTPWPEEQRARWHAAFRAMTDAIYRNG